MKDTSKEQTNTKHIDTNKYKFIQKDRYTRTKLTQQTQEREKYKIPNEDILAILPSTYDQFKIYKICLYTQKWDWLS